MTKPLSFLDNISKLRISYAYTQSASSLHHLAELGRIEEGGHMKRSAMLVAKFWTPKRDQSGCGSSFIWPEKIPFKTEKGPITSRCSGKEPSLKWFNLLFAWQDIKRQNMPHDLLYYLPLKWYITDNHFGQNHKLDNKTITIKLQVISFRRLATPFSIFF